MKLFASVFGLIFLAELPDKTAIAALILATRRSALAVFFGAAAAFAVQSAVAVFFGSFLTIFSPRLVHVASGILFIVFAALMWLRRESEEEDLGIPALDADHFWHTARVSFLTIFVAEWGDLTQLATAALVAKNGRPELIFFAATAALWCVTALAVIVGQRAKRLINPRLVQKIAALAFFLVGVAILLRN